MQSRNGTRGWRLDYDPADPNKGIHINWWYTPDPTKQKISYEGMIKIDATYDKYLDIISHFTKK